MLFDDSVALRAAIGLFRSGAHGVVVPPVLRQKASSGDLRSQSSRAAASSLDLDLHVLQYSPKSFRELELSDSDDLEDDSPGGSSRSSPKKAPQGKGGEAGAGATGADRERRSISAVTNSSVELVVERLPREVVKKAANNTKQSLLTDSLQVKARTSPIPGSGVHDRNRSMVPPGPGLSPQGGGPDDPSMLKLTIYLPDRTPFNLKVSDAATVDEVIRQVIHSVKSHPVLSGRVRLQDHTGVYELRLHEGDGEADEDFPALDRQRKVKHFGEGNVHEYCLREVANARGGRGGGGGDSSSPPPPLATPRGSLPQPFDGATIIMVTLPNRTQAKMEVTEGMVVKELLQAILRKNHRLQFSTDRFCLHVPEEERQRRRLASSLLDDDVVVTDLNVEELVLRRKAFADDPAPVTGHEKDGAPGVQWQGGQGGAARPGEGEDRTGALPDVETRPGPDEFVFSDVTAFVYKEWNVVKKNKFGRKQPRIMGLDDVKIYNYKRDSRGNKSTDGVYRAERPIPSVRSVDFVEEDLKTFRILFEEDGGLNALEYTTETVYECAEIVYKLRYVIEAISRQRQKTGGVAPGAAAK